MESSKMATGASNRVHWKDWTSVDDSLMGHSARNRRAIAQMPPKLGGKRLETHFLLLSAVYISRYRSRTSFCPVDFTKKTL
jgi:hypothetical protein